MKKLCQSVAAIFRAGRHIGSCPQRCKLR